MSYNITKIAERGTKNRLTFCNVNVENYFLF
jgi:hypothetical protein